MHSTEPDETVIGPDATDTLCETCAHMGCGEGGDDPSCRDCILDGARGVHLPMVFAVNFDMTAWRVSADDVTALRAGVDHPDYWEAWDSAMRGAHFKEQRGGTEITWRLEQDGDLFAYVDHVKLFEKGSQS